MTYRTAIQTNRIKSQIVSNNNNIKLQKNKQNFICISGMANDPNQTITCTFLTEIVELKQELK